jgi:hypothetical protein
MVTTGGGEVATEVVIVAEVVRCAHPAEAVCTQLNNEVFLGPL